MSFTETRQHSAIFDAIRKTLDRHGFTALRADSRSYSDDLLLNVQAYLYGCSFGIALFERLESEVFNPNVSFEVGYLYGLGKPVCLLKERTLRQLHADIVGKLYVQFDAQTIGHSIGDGLTKWLADRRLI